MTNLFTKSNAFGNTTVGDAFIGEDSDVSVSLSTVSEAIEKCYRDLNFRRKQHLFPFEMEEVSNEKFYDICQILANDGNKLKEEMEEHIAQEVDAAVNSLAVSINLEPDGIKSYIADLTLDDISKVFDAKGLEGLTELFDCLVSSSVRDFLDANVTDVPFIVHFFLQPGGYTETSLVSAINKYGKDLF